MLGLKYLQLLKKLEKEEAYKNKEIQGYIVKKDDFRKTKRLVIK